LVLGLIVLGNARLAGAQTRHLKDVVYKVEAQYHERSTQQFLAVAQVLREQKAGELADIFTALAQKGSSGSGWLFTDKSEKYIITNAHVVDGAASVTLTKELKDKPGHRNLGQATILFVDTDADLAVIEAPDSPDIPDVGLSLAREPINAGDMAYSVGFPGITGEQIWYFSRGEINNPQAPKSAIGLNQMSIDSFIAHNAKIDRGNSGGPLMVPVNRQTQNVNDTDASVFEVVGVNTFRAGTNHYFSIPQGYVVGIRNKADVAMRNMATDASRIKRLEEQATIFRAELSRVRTSEQEKRLANIALSKFMSQSYVSRYGLPAFLKMLPRMDKKEEMLEWMATDQLGALRFFAAIHFAANLGAVGDLTTAKFQEIDVADRRRIGAKGELSINTIFQVANRKQDIYWTLEYGEWRIADLRVQLADGSRAPDTTSTDGTLTATTTTPEPKTVSPARPDVRSLGLLFRAASGSLTADGTLLDGLTKNDLSGAAFSLLFDKPLSRGFVGLVFGLSYMKKGVGFQGVADGSLVKFEELVNYVQVPLMLRADFSIPAGPIFIRPFLRVGGAFNVVVSKEGKFSSEGASASLTNTYYSKHTPVNASILYGGGLEVDLGGFSLGLDFNWDNHLLNEWADDKWEGENSKYSAFYRGAFVKAEL
jgi:hypothetical protein